MPILSLLHLWKLLQGLKLNSINFTRNKEVQSWSSSWWKSVGYIKRQYLDVFLSMHHWQKANAWAAEQKFFCCTQWRLWHALNKLLDETHALLIAVNILSSIWIQKALFQARDPYSMLPLVSTIYMTKNYSAEPSLGLLPYASYQSMKLFDKVQNTHKLHHNDKDMYAVQITFWRGNYTNYNDILFF